MQNLNSNKAPRFQPHSNKNKYKIFQKMGFLVKEEHQHELRVFPSNTRILNEKEGEK